MASRPKGHTVPCNQASRMSPRELHHGSCEHICSSKGPLCPALSLFPYLTLGGQR